MVSSTLTTFWAEYQLWGLAPFGYHLNNIILHALNAFLLWIVLSRLKVPGAMLAAALFAIHPVHVESVAWVTERKNVLSGFFYLLSLLCYLRFSRSFGDDRDLTIQPADQPEASDDGWRFYAVSLIFFAAALLSKTITATLPAVILVLIWWKNGAIRKRDIVRLIPFFILGIGFGLTTAWLETYHVGAQGKDFAYGFVERCLIAGRALWFYLYKLVWPQTLMFIYPRWEIDPAKWWQYLFPASFGLTLIGLFLFRRRIGRGPLAAMLIFAGSLFPALGFLNVYPHRFSFVADHFQYLASIAIIALMAAFVTVTGAVVFTSRNKQFMYGLVVVLLLFNLGLKSACQAFCYTDAVALWEDTIAQNEDCWMAYNNLGAAYFDRKEYAKAESALLTALKIRPNFELAHSNIGFLYLSRNDLEKALLHYNRLLELYSDQSGAEPWTSKWILPFVYANLGKLHSLQGQYEKAVFAFGRALPLLPKDASLHNDLGVALYSYGEVGQAIAHFKRALEILPDYREAKYNLDRAQK
jgi:tetratricopeptide (TPR) repeat protein